jgi:hypothetical protein
MNKLSPEQKLEFIKNETSKLLKFSKQALELYHQRTIDNRIFLTELTNLVKEL